MECLDLIEYLKIVHSENKRTNSILELYQLLKGNKIQHTSPDVEIGLRVFLTMLVTN